MSTLYVMSVILAMAVTTVMLRAVPFLLPRQYIDHPVSQKLARFMPLIIMVTLVVHTFKDASWTANGTAVPLSIGVLAVASIQYLFRIPLLSIVVGVAIYVTMVNLL